MRALAAEDELEVVIRYKLGLSTLALAERFAVDEATIRRILSRSGVERRPAQARNPVTPLRVAVLRTAGLTWSEIAEKSGCSVSTARNRWQQWLREEVHAQRA